ncbi:hypothetical protein ABI125_08250 [Tamlana crocina]
MKFFSDILVCNEPSNWWQEYRAFCDDFKNVEIDEYVKALPTLVLKLQNSYGFRNLQVALEREAKNNPSFGKAIYKRTLGTNNADTYFTLKDILSGLFYSDQKFAIAEVEKLIKHKDKALNKIGLDSVAKFDLNQEETPKDFIIWIERALEDITNKQSKSELWPSVLFVARLQRKSIKNADTLLEKLSEIKILEVQLELMCFLFYNLDLETEMSLLEKYLPNLLHIDLEHSGAYSQLSHNLENLTKQSLSLVVRFLTVWVEKDIDNARKISYFSYLLNTLIDDFYLEFQKLFTNRLNSDNPNFHIAIFNMNRVGNIRDLSGLKVSKEVVKTFSDFDIEYITYKILAYIYDKDTSVSLVYSILELKYENKNVNHFLSDLIANHLIFNYYSVIDFLNEKKKSANAKLKKVITKIIKAGEARYIAYSDLTLLKEFEPSERRLIYYNKIQSRKFSKSYRESENNQASFFNTLNTINYRTGKSCFSKYEGKYTEKMTPALISHRGEMPRGEFIDPVGQAKERLLWQNFNRRK